MELQQYHNGLYIPSLLGTLDQATIENIVKIAEIKWNKKLADGTLHGSINTTYNNTKISGRYSITPDKGIYAVHFEFQYQGKKWKEGVYSNECIVACMELCKEDLLTRLAKVHKNMPHFNEQQMYPEVQHAQKSYNKKIHNPDRISFL